MSSTAAPRNPWIVSPWWDLAYLIATPLVIVPAVLLLVRHWFTPEQITLVAISFASMGHHLPGFMRAYGDRELFARYRGRFLAMPVLIFALALLFSPPSWVAGPLGLSWQHLHGLELILLLWGTWHGLMQTYGFMRIYDVKRGIRDRWTARLDHWLCLAIFGCGYLFSDARMYGTAEVMWQIGLPVFGRGALDAIRASAGTVMAFVLALYIVHMWRQERHGDGVSWNKILLAASTGWIYWYTGKVSTNLIIGLAIFEIYHAIQYYAIVWFYNRHAVERDGSRFGWLAFLFRDRWTMLGLYLAIIAAFGSLRFFTVDTADYVFRGGELDSHKLLIAFLITSTFLHFYFDGFIWKVSDARTQRTLVGRRTGTGSRHTAEAPIDCEADEGACPRFAAPARMVPAIAHTAKCGLFFAAAIGFLYLEQRARQQTEAERTYVAELAALTPDLPELQIQLSRDALDRGDVDLAIRSAQAALDRRPRSHAAYGDLAVAWMTAGDHARALPLLQTAATLRPQEWRYHTNLGLVYTQLARPSDAEQAFRRAVALRPRDPMPYIRLADWLLADGRASEALVYLDEALQNGGDAFSVRLAQVEALIQAGEPAKAKRIAVWLCRARPESADAHVALGSAFFASGQPQKAAESLRKAVGIQPDHVAGQFRLGNALYALGDTRQARDAYRAALAHDPDHAQAHANLGAALLAEGDLAESESYFRRALALDPDMGGARVNLAVALLRQGWTEAATEQITQARQSGQTVPEELLAELDLAP